MRPVAILAGGLATRLRPLTEKIPKALLEIAGEPFIAHQLRLLRAHGIERVVLCVGYLGEMVREYVGDGRQFGMSVEYSFDGPVLRGTGGAIRQALPLLGDSFFVLYGDSYLPCDYAAIQESFLQSGRTGLMTVFRNEGLWDSSNVEFGEGRIIAYDKKNRSERMRYIDYGLGLFHRRAFDAVGADDVYDLARLYQGLLKAGELAGYEVPERFYEIGSVAGIEELSALLAKRPKAVFLDRDGVLNEAVVREGKPYPPGNLREMRIFPEAAALLQRLKELGFLLVVVTNQPDVSRGKQDRETVEEMNRALSAALPLDEVLVCYHSDHDGCSCRKPLPGLFFQAAERFGIDLPASFMIGDRWRDVDAGHAAGCRTVLIDYGYRESSPTAKPDARVHSLEEAVRWVIAAER
jgi:N-acetyl-alpha-D-muramate 1-phosphate uridylyltransferase